MEKFYEYLRNKLGVNGLNNVVQGTFCTKNTFRMKVYTRTVKDYFIDGVSPKEFKDEKISIKLMLQGESEAVEIELNISDFIESFYYNSNAELCVLLEYESEAGNEFELRLNFLANRWGTFLFSSNEVEYEGFGNLSYSE